MDKKVNTKKQFVYFSWYPGETKFTYDKQNNILYVDATFSDTLRYTFNRNDEKMKQYIIDMFTKYLSITPADVKFDGWNLTGGGIQRMVNVPQESINRDESKQINETATSPGITMYNTIHKKSGESNKEGVKLQMDNAARLNKLESDTEKEKLSAIGTGEPKYANFDKDKFQKEKEYNETLRGYGLQDLDYDVEPAQDFQDRAEEAIEGSARMGNSPDYANAMRDFDGTKGELGKQVIDIAKKKKEIKDASNDTEDRYSLKIKYPHKKGEVNLAAEGKLQNLKTKRVIYYEKDIDNLIPESHKVEGATFRLTDGKSTIYDLKWEGGVLVVESEKNRVIEESEIEKSKKLMGYGVGSYKVKPKPMIKG
jgi:hypothetical protein